MQVKALAQEEALKRAHDQAAEQVKALRAAAAAAAAETKVAESRAANSQAAESRPVGLSALTHDATADEARVGSTSPMAMPPELSRDRAIAALQAQVEKERAALAERDKRIEALLSAMPADVGAMTVENAKLRGLMEGALVALGDSSQLMWRRRRPLSAELYGNRNGDERDTVSGGNVHE